MTGQSVERQPVKSAARVLELVEYLAARGAVAFNDIVGDLSLPKSSTHGLLRTLEDAGWVHHDPETRRYSLGLKAWQVGQRYDGNGGLAEAAKPIMDELTRYTGETVQLARLDGVENVYIAISPSPNPMRMASTVGMRLHAHATGIGKALLSTLDPTDARARLEGVVLPRLTEHTVTDVDELIRIVQRTADTGYAVDDEEFVVGCRCVAVPLTRESETGIAAALSVTLPTQRTPQGWPQSLYAPLSDAAARIRARMGLSAARD